MPDSCNAAPSVTCSVETIQSTLLDHVTLLLQHRLANRAHTIALFAHAALYCRVHGLHCTHAAAILRVAFCYLCL